MSTSLSELGWSAVLESKFSPYREQGLEPARVAREDRDRFTVLAESGECLTEVTGKFRHTARRRSDYPAVGDWVAVRVHDPGHATIHAVLPRASCFVRKDAGKATDEQVLAANLDTVLLVTAPDGDLNVRRLERYLAAAWESGASAAVVLNKADLADDPQSIAAETAAVLGVTVVSLSAQRHEGLDALAPWIAPGKTVALLGSSGVGKSTLANALLARDAQATGEVREKDRRGRHTTTARELFVLPAGGVLIDTPGLRQFQLWTGEEALEETFADIEEVAAACHFRDCTHAGEPACAVRAAIAEEALDTARFESWRKLQREVRYLESKTNRLLREEQKQRWKAIHKAMRNDPRVKRAKS